MIQSMAIIWERQNDLTTCTYISWNNVLYLGMTPYWLKIRHISQEIFLASFLILFQQKYLNGF